jgi:hypothetical protein
MVKKETQAIIVVFIVIALALVHIARQQGLLWEQVGGLQESTSALVENLYPRISELEGLLIECEVMIDNGTENVKHTVCLTKGATALDALRRVAVVETTFYAGLGEYINSIDGLRENFAANKFWIWYIWENGAWTLAPVGAGAYELVDGDYIKFSYEAPPW